MSLPEFSSNSIDVPQECTMNINITAVDWRFVYDEIVAQAARLGDGSVNAKDDTSAKPQRPQYNGDGQLIEYLIGSGSDKSKVNVEYQKNITGASVISRLEIARPDGKENIVYKREQGEPSDPLSPFVYSETRNGSKGDLLFSGLTLDKDGRINLFINKGRLAITFNPETGAEELP